MACFYFVNITDKEFKMKQHGMFNPKLMFYLLKCTFLVYMDIDFILKITSLKSLKEKFALIVIIDLI